MMDRLIYEDRTRGSRQDKQKALHDAYKHIFSTPEGQMVLEDLIDSHYIRRSTYELPSDTNELVAYREGGKNAVLRILALSGYTLAAKQE